MTWVTDIGGGGGGGEVGATRMTGTRCDRKSWGSIDDRKDRTVHAITFHSAQQLLSGHTSGQDYQHHQTTNIRREETHLHNYYSI